VYKNCLPQENGIECSVLALVFLMRGAYYTQLPDSQEIIDKFMTLWKRKWYITRSFPILLHQLKKNEGNFMLTWISGEQT